MTVALILDFPGSSRQQYDEVIDTMDLGGRMAPGGVFHAAGPYQDGWRVIDVWEDMAHFERFRDEQIAPVTAAAGMSPPQVRAIEVAELLPGSGAVPELVQVVDLPGLDADSFEAIHARVLPDRQTPDELTLHVNGPTETGWCVIDAWSSTAARDRFLQERVQPAAEGSALTGPPQIEDLPVAATLRETTAHRI
jgi:quinol monooxygenase YgiN